MPRGKSVTKEVAAKDVAMFLSVLDNEEVIIKLATVLSASINLSLVGNLKPVHSKLDSIAAEFKTLQTRLVKVEQENDRLLNDK
jgi:hypothetical protein